MDYLSERGVRIALQGHAPFSAAVQAVYDTLKAQRDGVPNSKLERVASADTMRKFTRAGDYAGWQKDYL